jgi:hypothetical protein
MGLFDWFEPAPPVRCLKCKDGEIHGWQEKPIEPGLFLWRQGFAAPVDQPIDDECKIDESRRSLLRLSPSDRLEIYYGTCDRCGAMFPYRLPLKFTGDTWTGFSESANVRFASEIDIGWLQCPICFNAHYLEGKAWMVVCPDCKILLIKRPSETPREAEQDSGGQPATRSDGNDTHDYNP